MHILFHRLYGAATVLLAAALVLATPDPSAHTSSASTAQPTNTWNAFVDERRQATRTPGLAYAVVDAQGIQQVRGLGIDGDGETIDRSSVFIWGSVSKPVAATLTAGLARDGELDVTARVVDLLPSFRTRDRSASDRITVRQLLDHTSGLPPALRVTDRDDPTRRPIDGVRELQDLDLVDTPGSAHHYSSANYLVLSAVLEEVTGQTYADLLADRLLDPLAMESVVTTSAEAERELPPGHRYVAGRTVALDSPYDPAGLAYGYLAGSIDDLAAFARAALGGAPDVVSAADLSTTQRPATTTSAGGTYGQGWRQSRLADFGVDSDAAMTWHSGAAPGYQSAVVLLPEQRRAVVVLQNAYGFFQEDALLNTAVGLAALVEGSEPPAGSGAGWTYPAILAGLGVLVALLACALVRGVVRVARPRIAPSRRRVLARLGGWLVVCAVVAYGLGIVVPSLAGLTLSQLPLWALDVGWLSAAGVALALMLAPVSVLAAARETQATAAPSPANRSAIGEGVPPQRDIDFIGFVTAKGTGHVPRTRRSQPR